MNHAEIVRKYLKDRKSPKDTTMGYPFVTISRASCAGGHTLARQIIRELEDRHPHDAFARGWEVFDQKLCVLLAEDPKLKVSFEQLVTEQYHSEAREFIYDMFSGRSQQYTVFKKTFQVIRILSRVGRVVLVGRGSNFLTRDLPQGLHIRTVAGLDERIERMARMLEISEKEAKARVKEQDRDRARLVKDYFDQDVRDPENYDAVFNTSTMDIKEIAVMAADMIEAKWEKYKQAVG